LLCNVSPDGRILAFTEDSRALLYSSQSSEKPEKEFQFEHGEVPSAWTADGKFLYLVRLSDTPSTITRFEIDSGRRSLWKQVSLPPEIPGTKCDGLVITPDGKSYAFTYSDHASELYLVRDLK
jgi:Tol biopolymer transport system component